MTTHTRARAVACFAAMTCAQAGLAPTAGAQGAKDFPTKPITLIVPWNAGGSTDIYFRALGEAVSKFDFVDRYMGPADYTKFVAEIVAKERAALEKLGLAKKD